MCLAELNPEECEQLAREFRGSANVRVECDNGYAALRRWLPPEERRGVVLIDPPYENAAEWTALRTGLLEAVRRFAQGLYCVWYPLKVGLPVERFKADVVASGLRKVLIAEIGVWPEDSPFRLNGCGMMIVNPPWQLDETLREIVPSLAQRLANVPEVGVVVDWLVPE